jgi:hypothetical protein
MPGAGAPGSAFCLVGRLGGGGRGGGRGPLHSCRVGILAAIRLDDAGGDLRLAQQTNHGRGRLGALAHPILDLRRIQMDRGGISAGIVVPQDRDKTAVARRAGIRHDDAIVGLELGALAAQPDLKHRFSS